MGGVCLDDLRAANVARQMEWCPEQIPDLSFRGNELAGETGEACNVIKKLERERHGWRGSRGSVAHLAEELADVVITADLVAIQAGIDLGAAVVAKFDATSEKNGLATRLQPETERENVVACWVCDQRMERRGKGFVCVSCDAEYRRLKKDLATECDALEQMTMAANQIHKELAEAGKVIAAARELYTADAIFRGGDPTEADHFRHICASKDLHAALKAFDAELAGRAAGAGVGRCAPTTEAKGNEQGERRNHGGETQ